MVGGQRKKRAWLQSLAGLRPDFVVNTGDNLSDPEGVPEALDALGPLMEFPGVYVFGSNDYYGPKLRNPARYLFEKAQGRARPQRQRAGGRRRAQPVGGACGTRSTRRAG